MPWTLTAREREGLVKFNFNVDETVWKNIDRSGISDAF